MSGNSNEMPPESTRLRDRASTAFQQRRQQRSELADRIAQRRREFADAFGVNADGVRAVQRDDRGQEVGLELTDEGQQQAETELREQFASERENITPEDVSASIDPQGGETDVGIDPARQDAVRDRVEQSIAERNEGIAPDDVNVEVSEQGVEGIGIDQPAAPSGGGESTADLRERAIEQAASQSDRFGPDDFTTEATDGTVEARLSREARSDLAQQLRQDTAADIDGVVPNEIDVEQTESGFEASVSPSAVRREAAEEIPNIGLDDVEVREQDGQQQAVVDRDVLANPDAAAIGDASGDQVVVESITPARRDTEADAQRREQIQESVAEQFDTADVAPSDVAVEFDDSGEPQIDVPDSAQREEVLAETADEFENFGRDELRVVETDEGLRTEVDPTAVVEDARQRAVATQVAAVDPDRAAEVFGEVNDRLDPEARATIGSQISETLTTSANTIDPTVSERFTDELAARALDDEFLGIDSETVIDAREQVELSDSQRATFQNELSESATQGDPIDVTDIPEPVQEQLVESEFDGTATGVTAAALRERVAREQFPDIAAEDIPVQTDDTGSVSLSDEFIDEQRQRQREELREQVATEAEDFGPDDVVISETEDGSFEGSIADDALRSQLREDAASELDEFGRDDIVVTETDDGFTAEVAPEARADRLISETSPTLFLTAAGGDALQAAIDIRSNLESIPGRDSINAALEDSGSELRSTAPVAEIFRDLDPDEVASRQDNLNISPEQVETAQQAITTEQQEAQQNPDAFLTDVDEYALTDALDFDNSTERGSARRSALRERAEELEAETAAELGVDESDINYRATIDGLDATNDTRATIARQQAAEQFGVFEDEVVVEQDGDSFEARLSDQYLENQAIQEAAGQPGIDPSFVTADAENGQVDVGFDTDAVAADVAEQQGVDPGDVVVDETDSGLRVGLDPEVREQRVAEQVAAEREGVTADDVSADVDSAFADDVAVDVDVPDAGFNPTTSTGFTQTQIGASTGENVANEPDGPLDRFVSETLNPAAEAFEQNVAEPTGQFARDASPVSLLDQANPLGNPIGRTTENLTTGAVNAVNPAAAVAGGIRLGQATASAAERTLSGEGAEVAEDIQEGAVGVANSGVESVRTDPVGSVSSGVGAITGGVLFGTAAARGARAAGSRISRVTARGSGSTAAGTGAATGSGSGVASGLSSSLRRTLDDLSDRGPNVELRTDAAAGVVDVDDFAVDQLRTDIRNSVARRTDAVTDRLPDNSVQGDRLSEIFGTAGRSGPTVRAADSVSVTERVRAAVDADITDRLPDNSAQGDSLSDIFGTAGRSGPTVRAADSVSVTERVRAAVDTDIADRLPDNSPAGDTTAEVFGTAGRPAASVRATRGPTVGERLQSAVDADITDRLPDNSPQGDSLSDIFGTAGRPQNTIRAVEGPTVGEQLRSVAGDSAARVRSRLPDNSAVGDTPSDIFGTARAADETGSIGRFLPDNSAAGDTPSDIFGTARAADETPTLRIGPSRPARLLDDGPLDEYEFDVDLDDSASSGGAIDLDADVEAGGAGGSGQIQQLRLAARDGLDADVDARPLGARRFPRTRTGGVVGGAAGVAEIIGAGGDTQPGTIDSTNDPTGIADIDGVSGVDQQLGEPVDVDGVTEPGTSDTAPPVDGGGPEATTTNPDGADTQLGRLAAVNDPTGIAPQGETTPTTPGVAATQDPQQGIDTTVDTTQPFDVPGTTATLAPVDGFDDADTTVTASPLLISPQEPTATTTTPTTPTVTAPEPTLPRRPPDRDRRPDPEPRDERERDPLGVAGADFLNSTRTLSEVSEDLTGDLGVGDEP